jgi:hypothetical protein
MFLSALSALRGPSIVLAVLDTTDARQCGCRRMAASGADGQPTIDALPLARSGVLYGASYAECDFGRCHHTQYVVTPAAVQATHGVRDGNGQSLESVPTLAGDLKRGRYETMGQSTRIAC